MPDPVTKLLTDAAAELFSASEKKQIHRWADDLRAAQEKSWANDAGALARNLAAAQDGNDPEGKPISDPAARVANVHRCHAAVIAGPLHSIEARDASFAVHDAARPLAHRLLEAAACRAEKLIHEIPPLPLPPAFVEWELSADLPGIFRQMAQSALEALRWELIPRHWGMAPREAGWGWLERAGLAEGEK